MIEIVSSDFISEFKQECNEMYGKGYKIIHFEIIPGEDRYRTIRPIFFAVLEKTRSDKNEPRI